MKRTSELLALEAECERRNLDLDNIHNLSKFVLQNYSKEIKKNKDLTSDYRNWKIDTEERENVRQVFLDLFHSHMSLTKNREDVRKTLMSILGSNWVNSIITGILPKIESFPYSGKKYLSILKDTYLSKEIIPEEILCEKYGLSRTHFYQRKGESTILFGIFLYERALNPVFVEE